jgi:hypothetical protein
MPGSPRSHSSAGSSPTAAPPSHATLHTQGPSPRRSRTASTQPTQRRLGTTRQPRAGDRHAPSRRGRGTRAGPLCRAALDAPRCPPQAGASNEPVDAPPGMPAGRGWGSEGGATQEPPGAPGEVAAGQRGRLALKPPRRPTAVRAAGLVVRPARLALPSQSPGGLLELGRRRRSSSARCRARRGPERPGDARGARLRSCTREIRTAVCVAAASRGGDARCSMASRASPPVAGDGLVREPAAAGCGPS